MFSTITSFKTYLGPKLFSIAAIEKNCLIQLRNINSAANLAYPLADRFE